MARDINSQFNTMKVIFGLLIISVVFALAPFVIYEYQISQGILTNANDWYAQGTNHGPWRGGELEGFLIFCPQIVLFLVCLLYALIESLEKGKLWVVAGAILLTLFQVAVFALQLKYLTWLID